MTVHRGCCRPASGAKNRSMAAFWTSGAAADVNSLMTRTISFAGSSIVAGGGDGDGDEDEDGGWWTFCSVSGAVDAFQIWREMCRARGCGVPADVIVCSSSSCGLVSSSPLSSSTSSTIEKNARKPKEIEERKQHCRIPSQARSVDQHQSRRHRLTRGQG